MKLVEVVSGADTDAKIVEAALSLMKGWGKVAVMARDVPGFIVNRVARPFYSEGWRALEEGAADAATIDFLFRDLAGFRMGPFELGDLIGHDINTAAAKSVFDAYYGRVRFTPSLMQEQLVAAGRLGRKSGRGVYDYGEGAAKPEPALVSAERPGDLHVRVSTFANELKWLFNQCGLDYTEEDETPLGHALVDDTIISFTSGEPAALVGVEYDAPAVVLDWMRDPSAATAMAFAASSNGAAEVARKVIAACGKKAVQVKDRPGLVVYRTLCQLANCAADAVRDQVADAASIDKAMINGVNYPFGPLGWASDAGFGCVASALDTIAEETGEAMYKPSEALVALARGEV